MIIGIVNLYYVYNSSGSSEQNDNSNIIDDQGTSVVTEQNDEVSQVDDENSNFSEEELLIKQNFDMIQQFKAEYTNKDTKYINGDSVYLYIYENAGYMFQDSKK